MNQEKRKVKSISLETFVFLGVLLVGFSYIGNKMGAGIMFSVIMETAHDLLLDTAFFIMALAVVAVKDWLTFLAPRAELACFSGTRFTH